MSKEIKPDFMISIDNETQVISIDFGPINDDISKVIDIDYKTFLYVFGVLSAPKKVASILWTLDIKLTPGLKAMLGL